MYCPSCQATDTKVIETRILQNGLSIRRRRRCESCDKRFTTYENIPLQIPAIVKADGRRESFNRDKVIKGMTKACQKRPISRDQIHELVDQLERHLADLSVKEIDSDTIGNFVMSHLFTLDPVSYVRYASFYWEFNDIEDFVKNLQSSLLKRSRPKEEIIPYLPGPSGEKHVKQ